MLYTMSHNYYIFDEKKNTHINEKISNINENTNKTIKKNGCQQKDVSDNNNVDEDQNIECLICFEEINLNNHIYCKTCKNLYHEKCLKLWFKKTNNNVCTYCQQPTLCKHKNYFKIIKKCLTSIFS
jgi:hypothetical protein